MPISDTPASAAAEPVPLTPPDDGWRAAGAAWGHAATDWAFMFEQYGRDAVEHVYGHAQVGPDVRLLDTARIGDPGEAERMFDTGPRRRRARHGTRAPRGRPRVAEPALTRRHRARATGRR